MFVYYFNTNTGEYCACLDNPGKFYALVFNVTYLAPLTYLFVMFWIDSYVKGMKKTGDKQRALADSTAGKAGKVGASTSATSSSIEGPAIRTRSKKL